MTLMKVWLTGLELRRLLYILRNILDKNFRASTSEQVLLMWVELDRLDGSTLVDLGSRDTPSSHLQLLRVIFKQLLNVPKSDCTVNHTCSNNAHLINLVNPVQ